MFRAAGFALCLALAITAIVIGVAQVSGASAWIVGGVLGGGWATLLFAEAGE